MTNETTKTYVISIYDVDTDELKRERGYEGTFKNMCEAAENMTRYDEYWMWEVKPQAVETVERVRDSKGNAMLLANVERFGEQEVRVFNGGRKVYEDTADKFIDRYSDKFAWTLCADVRMGDDGKPEIVF